MILGQFRVTDRQHGLTGMCRYKIYGLIGASIIEHDMHRILFFDSAENMTKFIMEYT